MKHLLHGATMASLVPYMQQSLFWHYQSNGAVPFVRHIANVEEEDEPVAIVLNEPPSGLHLSYWVEGAVAS